MSSGIVRARRQWVRRRWEVQVPVHVLGPRRRITRYVHTRAQALEVASFELDAAWSCANDRTIARVARWDRHSGTYRLVMRLEKPEFDEPMVEVAR